mgnify:CR=1 FL=1
MQGLMPRFVELVITIAVLAFGLTSCAGVGKIDQRIPHEVAGKRFGERPDALPVRTWASRTARATITARATVQYMRETASGDPAARLQRLVRRPHPGTGAIGSPMPVGLPWRSTVKWSAEHRTALSSGLLDEPRAAHRRLRGLELVVPTALRRCTPRRRDRVFRRRSHDPGRGPGDTRQHFFRDTPGRASVRREHRSLHGLRQRQLDPATVVGANPDQRGRQRRLHPGAAWPPLGWTGRTHRWQDLPQQLTCFGNQHRRPLTQSGRS